MRIVGYVVQGKTGELKGLADIFEDGSSLLSYNAKSKLFETRMQAAAAVRRTVAYGKRLRMRPESGWYVNRILPVWGE